MSTVYFPGIFDSEDYDELTPSGEKPDIALLRYDLLLNIIALAKRSYDQNDLAASVDQLFATAELCLMAGFEDLYFLIKAAAAEQIFWLSKSDSEFSYQALFETYASTINKDWVIEKRKGDLRNVPDKWVRSKSSGEFIPVEVKRHKFDGKALSQLNRYISAFGCKRGIAVAEELSVELPENIVFVANSELRKLSANQRRIAYEVTT